MALPLSETEIQRRLKRLPYLERELKETRRERDEARAEVRVLQIQLAAALKENETLRARLEELERMVFGQSRRDAQAASARAKVSEPGLDKESVKREASSYRRKVPTEDEVTDRQTHELEICSRCGGPLSDCQQFTFFEEDMAPAQKTVTKHTVETGYCANCRQRQSPLTIPAQTAGLGPRVKAFLGYSLTLPSLSFAQTKALLWETWHLQVSDGELTNILLEQGEKLTPLVLSLRGFINRQEGSHTDETGWNVQTETQGRYAWARTGSQTEHAVYRLGQSRGGGHFQELSAGTAPDHKEVSDDYLAYRQIPAENHQLCWAHPERKLRELSRSDCLTEATGAHCQSSYQTFSAIYRSVRQARETALAKGQLKVAKTTQAKLKARPKRWSKPNQLDPAKLTKWKTSLRERLACYFVCLEHPHIPPDNNKAERKLRPLVLKRKNCFGSKTQAGAQAFGNLCSVLYSLRWTTNQPIPPIYQQLLANPEPNRQTKALLQIT